MIAPPRPAAGPRPPLWRSGDCCPGCGGGNWHVGRVTAECGRCGHALPLKHPQELRHGR